MFDTEKVIEEILGRCSDVQTRVIVIESIREVLNGLLQENKPMGKAVVIDVFEIGKVLRDLALAEKRF